MPATSLFAQTAQPVGPDAGSPLVWVVAFLYLAVYAVRWNSCRRDPGLRPAGFERLLAFGAGCALLAAALGPPLDSLAERSATMHMVQHVVLLDLIPILLLAGLTKSLMRPLTRRFHVIEKRAGGLRAPLFAVILYCAVMYAWHVPFLYDAALRHSAVHVLEHTTLLVAGGLYWWHLMSPVRERRRLRGTGPVIYMASTKVLVGILGLVLVFSPTALYAYTGSFLGMDPLTDQHVAGLVMATEQTLVMGIAFAALFLRMLTESERRQLASEEREQAADSA